MLIPKSLGRTGVVAGLAVGVVLGFLSRANAGVFATRSAVGGVLIDADGLVAAPQITVQRKLQVDRQKALQQIPGDLDRPSKLRKVSLRRLEKAVEAYRRNRVIDLPDEVKYLAGLQRVRYVFVYPEQHEIILAGPAEGWQIDGLGNVVGRTTGRPVLLLDDLMVALRTARTSERTGMSCSIDPTAEGINRLRALSRRLKTIGNPQRTLTLIEDALGPQRVSIDGVDPSTHFARAMIAADYRMKRLAMNFEPAPIPGLPSYLHLLKATRIGMQNMLPRWWLAPDYEPLLTDPEGLSWELRGQGVKCMTETDYVRRDGTRQPSGKHGSAALTWANNMTAHYDELATRDSAFGVLRNIMDLAVVAALIQKENLCRRAGLDLPYLVQDGSVAKYCEPKRVESKASVLKKRSRWLISASGGVQIYPWDVAAKQETTGALTPVRKKEALHADNRWWWN